MCIRDSVKLYSLTHSFTHSAGRTSGSLSTMSIQSTTDIRSIVTSPRRCGLLSTQNVDSQWHFRWTHNITEIIYYFDATNKDGVSLQLHQWIFSSDTDIWSGIHRYLFAISSTECQLQQCQAASCFAVITCRRLTAILTDETERPRWIRFQWKKQTWQDFFISYGIKVSMPLKFSQL